MHLTVELGTNGSDQFDIELLDNKFVHKWVKELGWCLANCDINQSEAFASFLTQQQAADLLESSCRTINQYLRNFIELRPNLIDQSQEYFNYLHQRFETLSGEFDRPTRLFLAASQPLKNAIRNLNFYIHQLEKKKSFNSLYISFDKDQYKRQPFELEDYENFEFDISPGTMCLHYVELGKSFEDVYHDQLPIDYAALKNLHYYSGEASLTFKFWDPFDNQGYFQWLQDNGIDPYNKRLGHGRIPLGNITELELVKQKLRKNRFIHKILIKD